MKDKKINLSVTLSTQAIDWIVEMAKIEHGNLFGEEEHEKLLETLEEIYEGIQRAVEESTGKSYQEAVYV